MGIKLKPVDVAMFAATLAEDMRDLLNRAAVTTDILTWLFEDDCANLPEPMIEIIENQGIEPRVTDVYPDETTLQVILDYWEGKLIWTGSRSFEMTSIVWEPRA